MVIIRMNHLCVFVICGICTVVLGSETKSRSEAPNPIIMAGHIGHPCRPITKVILEPCLKKFSKCSGATGGTCVCNEGFRAKYFFPAKQEGCFVQGNRPCQDHLFVSNFKEEMSGTYVHKIIERRLKELNSERMQRRKTKEEIHELRLFYNLWKKQVASTSKARDWACLSGQCGSNGNCKLGINPVLMESAEDPLPGHDPHEISRASYFRPLSMVIFLLIHQMIRAKLVIHITQI